ncbi:MAG: DNA methyltransferase [Ktedonobacteraceae bacterium]
MDGFAGSGMTGVAVQMCFLPNLELKEEVERERKAGGMLSPRWGVRRAILNDLGPAATFIAANYNMSVDIKAFEREATRILREVQNELGWMYETKHTDGTTGRINYTVWSDLFSCPQCAGEITFLEETLDQTSQRVRETFACPHCGVQLTKNQLERLYEIYFDKATNSTARRIRRKPVIINYSVGNAKYQKIPDEEDIAILARIESLPIMPDVPTNKLPFMHMTHQRARMESFGITHIHQFYLLRATQALGALWSKAELVEDNRLRHMLQFWVEQAVWTMALLNRFRPTGYSQVNQYMTGVYYIPAQHSECSPWYVLAGKLKRIVQSFSRSFAEDAKIQTTTGTAANLGLPDNSIDYVFTDPPFGENIYYADLNYLVESWHRVWTNAEPEAIIDHAKHKGLPEYQRLMQRCFEEYYRVLKPGRWMTVIFHNSRNSVWNAIQEAMQAAGFVIADVRTMDKQQGSYRQVTSSAVKQDLVISTYKPNGGLEDRFQGEAGYEEGVWDFVRTHLRQLPVFVSAKAGQGEVIAERLDYLLFDRMVAFHVQRGVAVPLSAPEFYAGLRQRFPQRDEMFFLEEQVAEYERKRLSVREIQQLTIFVKDEATAIQWLRQQLGNKPQTQAELTPQFMRELGAWDKHEKLPEMIELLEQNFLHYDGEGPIPAQIVGWMRKSSELREPIEKEIDAGMLREDGGLETREFRLLVHARDRWYVPDPNKAIDLDKLRIRALLREFATYTEGRGKLKLFRTEAVRAGFAALWHERDYMTITRVAERLPELVLQEDPDLLMYYDTASLRVHP